MTDTFNELVLARFGGPGEGVARVVDRLAPGSSTVVRKSASAALEREALRLELELGLRFELPSTPRVLACVASAEREVVVFEHAAGTSIERAELEPGDWLWIAVKLLEALGSAHDAGFVHGDLKPEHVIVSREGGELRLCVVDWGLTQKLGSPARGGTAGFLAPELLRGDAVSVASELYSFGVTLRSALGKRRAPAVLEGLLERCTSEAADERPASAWAAIATLGRAELPRRPSAPEVSFPRGLVEALSEGRVLLVEAPVESGRSQLARGLLRRGLAAQAPVMALEMRAGFDPVQRLADLCLQAGEPSPWTAEDGPEARASKAGSALARMNATVIVDDADHADEDGSASLLSFAKAFRATGRGALLLVGSSLAQRSALGPSVEEVFRLPPLDAVETTLLLRREGARSDASTVRDLLAASGGRAGRIARVARELAENPSLSVADCLSRFPLGSVERLEPEQVGDRHAVLAQARESIERGAPRRAAQQLRELPVDAADSFEHQLLLSRAEFAAGRLLEAEQLLAALAHHEAGQQRDEADLLHARVLERMGEHLRARQHAETLLGRSSGELRAQAAQIAAQSTLALGDPARATVFSELGLAAAVRPAARSRLLALASDAALRQHDPKRALSQALLAVDEASADEAALAHGLARVAAAHALTGAPLEARTAAAEALRHAELVGDVTALPPFVMNLATADHALGEYGSAAVGYERAAQLAERLGRKGSLAAALTNLGGLLCSLQGLEEARAVLERAREAAVQAGVPLFVAQCDLIAAETWLSRDLDAAEDLAQRAANGFEGVGATRQWIEAHVLAAEIELRRGEPARALSLAERLVDDARRGGLGPRVDLLTGEARLRLGLLDVARRDLERALDGARRQADRQHEVVALGLAAQLHDRLRTGAGDGYRAEARRALAEIAARLPAGLRERFLERFAASDGLRPSAPVEHVRIGADGRRLLRLAGRALRERDEEKLIETALDEAVAMTRAEHAFLLLRKDSRRPVVAAARNLDRETIRNSRFRFSRSVAERVLKSGEPVVAASAPSDPFLNQAKSVLDLGLVSVLCVPVRAESGVIAALYLDHRFEHGRFTDDDREVIQALADVIGLALEQARLRREAEAKADELRRSHEALSLESQQKDLELTRLLDALARGPTPVDEIDPEIVGRSPSLSLQLDVARRVAKTDLSVLIEGESGTGKELFARLLHKRSARSAGPFVAINCGALPESLIESELFGHVRGAFTGASRDHAGVFRAAERGTLFLDEVGELPLRVQTRLLRVLQERVVSAIGSSQGVAVDVRILAATNRNLDLEVEEGRFRADLFFRLAGVRLKLPALRERSEDLLPLCEALLVRLASEPGLRRVSLSRSASAALLAHEWPGNVRELEHALRRAVALSDGPELDATHFELRTTGKPVSRKVARQQIDRELVARVLASAKGNRTEAARSLGISRVTMQRLVSSLGVDSPVRRGRPKGWM